MDRTEKAATIRRLMQTEGQAVYRNTSGFNEGRYRSVSRLEGYEEIKQKARSLQEKAIARLPALIQCLRETVREHGGTVYLAGDADEANQYIRELCQSEGARRVAKSKSMTSEEIEVNEALEDTGIQVLETDLGQWVLQLAEEAPSHLVAPAIHKSRAEIAQLLNDRFAPGPPLETAEELTRFAREKLGEQIGRADVGMTGANFLAAETGTVCLVTSEGNARKSVYAPPVYVAVAGIEKILPSVEDFAPFLELIGRSATGQDLTSYVSLFTPPFQDSRIPHTSDGSTADEEDENTFHLVLIDNGRMEMREDEQLRETLYCIRCGACSNVCANFQQLGGHAFGGETYSGGIATGWEAGVNGLDSAASFNDLCTGCSRCVPACPVGIDIPWINAVVRDRINRGGSGALDWLVEGLTPDEEPAALEWSKRFFGHFETVAKLGSRLRPLSNWMASWGSVRRILEWTLGVDRRRALPTFAQETLREWMDRRRERSREEGDSEVVLYPDLFSNYVRPSRGRAAVRVLERLGCHVHVPAVGESGRAPLSQGMIQTATEKAEAVCNALEPHLEEGRDIVIVEPSDAAMFRRDYAKLLPEAASEQLRRQSFEVMEYVDQRLDVTEKMGLLCEGNGERVTYHSHCQQRTLDLERPTVSALQKLGYSVQTSSAECCGMAGSFGYKSDYYELSMEVGHSLKRELEQSGDWEETLLASGSSCQDQLEVLSGCSVRHPIELIDPRTQG